MPFILLCNTICVDTDVFVLIYNYYDICIQTNIYLKMQQHVFIISLYVVPMLQNPLQRNYKGP